MNLEQKKLLLIEPPFYRLFKESYSLSRYPLSLGYLAAAVRQETGWKVKVYNADFNRENEQSSVTYMVGEGFKKYLGNLEDINAPIWKEVEETIRAESPDVVGITMKSQNSASAVNVARMVKRVDESITVVVGGPHPTMAGPDMMKNPEVDLCVRGEGEETLIEILKVVEEGGAFDSVAGLLYRKEGKLCDSGVRSYIKDLDKLPFPHIYAKSALIGFDDYPKDAFKNIFATRGCPYNCFFCGSKNIWSRNVRMRSISNVLDEIVSLREMGVSAIHFDDDTFGIKKSAIIELCSEIIRRAPGLKWSCELHLKLVDDEIVRAMKESGCTTVQVGVESGNNEILKKMRKNITIEEAEAACEIVKKAGIRLETFYMIGLPWETEETIADTIASMNRVHSDYLIYSIFTPYPGTEAFEVCKDGGLIGENYNVSLYNHKSPENCFCLNIEKARFRELASEMERIVDKVNNANRRKRAFSPRAITKAKELGVGGTVKLGLKILLGK